MAEDIVFVEATHKLAFVIDNEVVQTFDCDERLAAILLSEPVVVDITSAVAHENLNHATYDSTTGSLTSKDTGYIFTKE